MAARRYKGGGHPVVLDGIPGFVRGLLGRVRNLRVPLCAVDARDGVTRLSRWANRVAPLSPGWKSAGLSRLFRFGTPPVAVLCAVGLAPWWVILIPVFPIWFSSVTTVHEANERARIIRRPTRCMSLDEAATERKFLFADAKATEAIAERIEALRELAEARTFGEHQAAVAEKGDRS